MFNGIGNFAILPNYARSLVIGESESAEFTRQRVEFSRGVGRILQACDPNSPENGPGRVCNQASSPDPKVIGVDRCKDWRNLKVL